MQYRISPLQIFPLSACLPHYPKFATGRNGRTDGEANPWPFSKRKNKLSLRSAAAPPLNLTFETAALRPLQCTVYLGGPAFIVRLFLKLWFAVSQKNAPWEAESGTVSSEFHKGVLNRLRPHEGMRRGEPFIFFAQNFPNLLSFFFHSTQKM